MSERDLTEATTGPCMQCFDHAHLRPELAEAATTAGAKLGMAPGMAYARYLAAFHRRGHLDETGLPR